MTMLDHPKDEHGYPSFMSKKLAAHFERTKQDCHHEQDESATDTNQGEELRRDAILMCSNDYLCLGREGHLRQAIIDSISGAFGADGSFRPVTAQGDQACNGPTVTRMSPIYMFSLKDNPITKFEAKFSKFLKAPDGVVSQSGFAANCALIQCTTGPDVPLYLDEAAHMSFSAGAKLSDAKTIIFRHNDADHAAKLMALYGPGVIAVETLYAHDGSTSPLLRFVELAEKHGAILIADESHSIGTHGPGGAGIVVDLGLENRIQFRTMSLAKSFASRAGFITSSSQFKDFFMAENLPMSFSSCLLHHDMAWLDAVLDYLPTLDERRKRMQKVSKYFRQQLKRQGYFNVADGTEQIVALICTTDTEAIELDNSFQSFGIFGSLFLHPEAPKDAPFLRLSINWGLNDSQIERVLQACLAIGQKFRDARRIERRQKNSIIFNRLKSEF